MGHILISTEIVNVQSTRGDTEPKDGAIHPAAVDKNMATSQNGARCSSEGIVALYDRLILIQFIVVLYPYLHHLTLLVVVLV